MSASVLPLRVHRGIHHLVADRVADGPDRPAVAAPDGDLTYQQLWDRSGDLAAALAARGVAVGDRVAVALDRSAALVVALLAIARTGSAYVPLDPSAPPARTAVVLAEAGCRLVVRGRDGIALPDGVTAVELPLVETAASWQPPAAFDTESPLYVAFTSGSTGPPKGVLVPHRAVLRLVTGPSYCRIGPGDRVAQLANPAFDATTFEVWATLAAGATIVVLPAAGEVPIGGWGELLARRRIVAMFLTTALFDLIARGEPTAFASLDTLLFGGETVDPLVVRRVLDAQPPARLVHVYGPTEATTFATYFDCTAETVSGRERVPIGFPLQQTSLRVLDGERRAVAMGAEGELWIGGPGVALGYLDRPEATAERFVPDGGLWYRTGDRVRQRPDGAIDFLGRTDRQVKLRGFRIEPGEIEAAALATGLVSAVAVDKTGDGVLAHLVGFAVAAEPRPDLTSALSAALHTSLPDYMVPTRWVVLPQLPLTGTGKIDRVQLLASVGGDRTAPLSTVQEGLWFLEAAEPGTAAYGIPLLLRWSGTVDRAALAGALAAVVARHEALRTTYRVVDDHPVQVVGTNADVPMTVIDATDQPDPDGAAQSDAELRAREPASIAAPPLRCTVWPGLPGGDLVLLSVHHIAVDGWSTGVLLADLATAYRAILAGESPDLPPLPVRFTDYATSERQQAASAATARLVAERAAELSDLVGELSLDRRPGPRPPVTGPRAGERQLYELDPALWTDVQELARRLRTTPFGVLLAAFAVVVRRWSGRAEFLLGTAVANRDEPELDEVVGLFANTVPIRCTVADDQPFTALCAAAADEALTALMLSSLPYDQLVSAATRERAALVQVVFGFLFSPAAARTGPNPPWTEFTSPDTGSVKFDLALFAEAGPDGLTLAVEYDTARYRRDLVDAIADGTRAVLAAVCRDPEAAIGALPRSTPAARTASTDLSAQQLARLVARRKEHTP
ncbi:amino acid adenylation domain-containing protein [Kutzneria sp. CA-103260]|uniref:amino acid adenylation domain-containing protein n=1 Tax=Kutzneria sp. CA-103260 TaxID=2802641 RepID=UPI001BA904AA|nr:amino acid adenylation domain-containing protein [Kutzneria sp. CA-103260]QUQ64655.1 D-alanine--D-alanyl carrier protein ligase [Kutzneria sp. CA-103260]